MFVRLQMMCCIAFFKLTTEGYLGAPVVDDRARYCGMIDLLDLV
jgi:hypothetical protein